MAALRARLATRVVGNYGEKPTKNADPKNEDYGWGAQRKSINEYSQNQLIP